MNISDSNKNGSGFEPVGALFNKGLEFGAGSETIFHWVDALPMPEPESSWDACMEAPNPKWIGKLEPF